MADLTRFWIIRIPIPLGTFDGYTETQDHIESYGTSWQAFARIMEIRGMFVSGVIPTLPVYLTSEPAHRVA